MQHGLSMVVILHPLCMLGYWGNIYSAYKCDIEYNLKDLTNWSVMRDKQSK